MHGRRRKVLRLIPLVVVGCGLSACGDESEFVDACMADGKAFKQACECTYRRLKADKRDDVIEAVVQHANRERNLGLGQTALVFAGTYLKCQL